jgi:hypothetical protein
MSATSSDEKVLEELRERRLYASSEWHDIREAAKLDMLYISGDPWPKKDRQVREEAGRPCVTVDELGQYVNQVINDLRQNKRGIKVTAQGNGANDQTALFRQGKIRDTEYRSNAQQAYTTMAQDAIQRSYGYLRIRAKFLSATGFNQEPEIEPVVNPDLILPDPDFLRSDGSDWKYLFAHQLRSVTEFTREFPRATKTSFSPTDMQVPGGWYDGKRLMLAEYWTKERVRTRRQYLLKPTRDRDEPLEAWEDDLKRQGITVTDDQILNDRDVDEYEVRQYLTNGFELLKKTPWPGKSIPFVGCFGKILYVDGKRVILSMVRLARDPAMLLNYIRSCQMELVGMTPKFPYFFFEGSLSQEALDLLAKSLHEPVAGIPVKPTVPGLPAGTPTPYPSKQPYEPAILALEAFAESMRRAIQAAIGTGFLPTQAQRQNEKSGRALDRINSSAQKGAFHFTDHYDEGVTRTGAILNEVLPAYFDTAQDTSIRNQKDEVEMVRINDPTAMKDGQPCYCPVLADHQHDVTISVGPAADSEREAASDFADALIQSPVAPVIMDLVVKLKNLGPIGDEIAERLTPPQFKKPKDGHPDPQQVQQQMGQMQQENAGLKDAVSKLSMEIKTKQVEGRTQIDKAKVDSLTALAVQQSRNAGAIAVAKIAALAKGLVSANEAEVEVLALGHEAEQAAFDRQHEANLAALDHASALDVGQQGQDHALEAGDQAHGQALDQLAAQPSPEMGAGA